MTQATDFHEADAKVLRYSGMLGHEFNVVIDGRDGRRVYCESSDLAFARQCSADNAGLNARIYRKTKTGWKLTA